ncbi:hypothetical protein C8R47DRAFT_1321685 [Mycena vitilis]|nr:hypothetical protein C8R47DRAFT_1321685 [Mycena vitilis]
MPVARDITAFSFSDHGKRLSDVVCAPDADVIVSSSDGVIFKLHRKHLEVHSDVFADAASATLLENGRDEVVQLSETSAVLDVLFQYMYRQPQPNLQVLEFATFAGVAEAAEKYVVYSALALFQMRMKDCITSHPLEVFRYAVKHDHVDLANESLNKAWAVKSLKPSMYFLWIPSKHGFCSASDGNETRSNFSAT